MRNILLLLFCLAFVPASAQTSAALVVQPIVFRHEGQAINIRVEVRNATGAPIDTACQVRLFARSRPAEPWRPLQSWDLGALPAGQLVARDYLPVPPVDPALTRKHPRLRAEVWMNGQCESFNETVTTHSDAP